MKTEKYTMVLERETVKAIIHASVMNKLMKERADDPFLGLIISGQDAILKGVVMGALSRAIGQEEWEGLVEEVFAEIAAIREQSKPAPTDNLTA